jgi:hypothetical protein
MRRQTRGARRPTREDLTDTQRRILEALPSDDLREIFLDQLPRIEPVSTSARKKAQQIQQHVNLLEAAIQRLRAHKDQLEAFVLNPSSETHIIEDDLRPRAVRTLQAVGNPAPSAAASGCTPPR